MRASTVRVPDAPVPRGPLAYRQAIRRRGPFLALVPPLALSVIGAILWVAWPCDGLECVTPSLLVYGLALLALPMAVPAGLPLFASPLTMGGAAVASAVVWLLLGKWAASRATTSPVATWREWWGEFALMTGGMWAGVLGGLLMTALVLSR